MTRNLKALGLALVAAFAMSAIAATTAQATTYEFTAAEYPAFVTGHQIASSEHGERHKFEAAGRSFECSEVTFDGTVEGPSNTLEVTPTYGGPEGKTCTATGNLPVTVTHNGCKFRFTVTANTSEHHYTGPVDIVCPEGQSIEVHIYASKAKHEAAHKLFTEKKPSESLCTLTIGSQNGLGNGTTTGTNEYIHDTGTPGDVTVTTTIKGIKYTTDGTSPLICGKLGLNENGTYTGSTTVEALEDIKGVEGAQIDATISP